jgi:signal transduction histidine kinase/CheY-like chemotaxis protein
VKPLRQLLLRDLALLMGLGMLAAGLGGSWLWFQSLTHQAERESLAGLRGVSQDLEQAFHLVEATGQILAEDWRSGQMDLKHPEQAEAHAITVVNHLPLASSVFIYLPSKGGLLITVHDLLRGVDGRTYNSYQVEAAGDGAPKGHLLRFNGIASAPHEEWISLGLTPSTRPWYQFALQHKTAGWVDPYPFIASETIGGLTYAVPLKGPNGAIEGVLGVDLLLEDLVDRTWALQPTPGSLVTLTDDQGRALLVPRHRDFITLRARRESFLRPVGKDFLPMVEALLRAGKEDEPLRIDAAGQKWLGVRKDMRGPRNVHWTLSLCIPMDELLAPARRSTLASMTLLFVLLIFHAWRLYAISQRFARPLADLARAADGLRKGEVPGIPSTDVVEIQALGEALHRAGEALHEKSHLQQQLQHSQRLETLGTLSGGIAHDVNNQLGAVLGQLELAEEGLPPDHPSRSRLLRAKDAVQRCAKTTRALLTFSHQNQPELRPLDLNTLVRDTASLLDRVLGGLVMVELQLQPSVPPVLGEPVQLEQVLMNLAINARDAMPEGGTLTLRTSVVHNGWIRLEVSDTGKGIPQDLIPHIFEPFFTTKAVGKGTGLGLAMVFGIVRSHKGRITVMSEPGKGTTFTVDMPSADLAAAEPSGAHSAIHVGEGSLAGLRILVIDDEIDLRETLADALTVARAQVATAADGDEAWALFSQTTFDMVLSDQRMPRLTGIELYRRIRVQNARLPFILSSGQDLDGFRAETEGDPHFRLLPKPFSVARLLELADELHPKRNAT